MGGDPVSRVDPLGLAGIMPGGGVWEHIVIDDGSKCGPLFPPPRADDGGCISTGGGPGICFGPGAIRGIGSSLAANFFQGTSYSSRVLGQMKSGDFHGFPRMVENSAGSGSIATVIQPSTGLPKEMLTIPGSLTGVDGAFEFIKHKSGVIYHRLFRPN